MPTVCLVIGVEVVVAAVFGTLDADDAVVGVMLGLLAVLQSLLLPPLVLLVVLV